MALILVVDDDSSIRRFIGTALRYATEARVVETADRCAAPALVRSIGRPVDVLISDIDLGVAWQGNDSAMKVLPMSGRDTTACDLHAGWRFLAKPNCAIP